MVVLVWLFSVTGTWLGPLRRITCFTQIKWPCLCPADSTTTFEPLSAPSSQHPLRKEAGQAAAVPHKLCKCHLLQGHWLFLDWWWITLRQREDPSDRKSPSTPPSSSGILGPKPDTEHWMVIQRCADGDQKEESPTEQGSHLYFNSGWTLPHWNLSTRAVWHE